MRKRVWVLSIIVLVMARPVWSDLLVEPFIGYSMGEAKGGGAKEDHSGVLYGGKLGYKMLGLSAGLRYDMGGIDAEEGNSSKEYDHRAYGFFVGYDVPLLFRVSAAYYISAERELETSQKAEESIGQTFEGSGISFHFASNFLPFIKFFLEYHKYDFDKVDSPKSLPSGFLGNTTWYVFGLSLPLDF